MEMTGEIVELGGGDNPRYRPNVDIRPGPTVDIVANLEGIFPIESNSYKGVYSEYLLEHIGWRKVPQFLRECLRILEPDGTAIFIIPNLKAQAKKIASKEEWDWEDISLIFGDQNFPDNLHKCGFSPRLITVLLAETGFRDITVSTLPSCETDMVVEAHKKSGKGQIFEREYFEMGAYDFYLDFPQHFTTVDMIMDMNPESVLDVGGARGFIVKHLVARGVPSHCMDISKWCYHNRVTDFITTWDARAAPWPFKDKQFDLAVSIALLEHIEEEYIDDVIKEFARVSKRGWHGISFEPSENDQDWTHVLFKPKEWWETKFSTLAPGYSVIIDDKETERESVEDHLPESDGNIKLNLGSHYQQYHHGWTNVDILGLHDSGKALRTKFMQYDVTKKVREEDNTVECIIASHLIEHLNKKNGKKLVEECYRVLKPGGVLRLATPDPRIIASKYLDGSISDFAIFNVGVSDDEADNAQSFWNLIVPGHKVIHDSVSLKNLLEEAGFINVHVMEFNQSRSEIIRKQTYDLHPSISFYMECSKPEEE